MLPPGLQVAGLLIDAQIGASAGLPGSARTRQQNTSSGTKITQHGGQHRPSPAGVSPTITPNV